MLTHRTSTGEGNVKFAHVILSVAVALHSASARAQGRIAGTVYDSLRACAARDTTFTLARRAQDIKADTVHGRAKTLPFMHIDYR